MALPNTSPAITSVPPGVANGPTFLGHPVGLFLLFAVEMWERFSFYGMRAILGLYLKCAVTGMAKPPAGAVEGFNPGRGWTQAEASNLVGWYGGMAYLLPIAGGLIADKFIGTHRSMVVGGLLIALGHIALAVSGFGQMAHSAFGLDVFIFGLVLIIIGTGHFKPSVSVMVNQLYAPGDPRQQGAFGIFYMGINLGAFLGTLGCGLIGENYGWHYGFGLAAIGMLAGLLLYIYARPRYLPGIGEVSSNYKHFAPGLVGFGLVASAGVAAMFSFGILGRIDKFLSQEWIGWTLLTIGVAWAVFFSLTQKKGDRGPVASIFIYMLFNFIFWLAFEQAATSVNFFTDERTNRELFSVTNADGSVSPWLVPTSWFQNINPLLIIILSPIFGIMWTYFARKRVPAPQPVKIGMGLIWLGLGYVFMVWAGHQIKGSSTALCSMWLIAVTYALHTIGELFLSPTGLAYVSKAAPKQSSSLLMGVWFVSSFLAYTIGGKLAGEADPAKIDSARFFFQNWGIDMGGGHANFFFLFVFLSIGAGLLIFLLTPLLRRLQRDPND